MPTGFTAGILDGKVNTFREFALVCVRAFGAATHMRDDGLNIEYKPREPEEYYDIMLKQAREEQVKIFCLTDEDIIEREQNRIKNSISYYSEKIKETLLLRDKIEKLLKEAKNYKVPTDEHLEIKKFMIEQLEITLDHDCSTKYYEEYLELAESLEGKPINPKEIREQLLDQANRDMAFAEEKKQENIKSCIEANEWVQVFLESIR